VALRERRIQIRCIPRTTGPRKESKKERRATARANQIHGDSLGSYEVGYRSGAGVGHPSGETIMSKREQQEYSDGTETIQRAPIETGAGANQLI
jgi:hypothetical protein